tara:strand:- start:2246 stop:3769 length:1524 start_codon:yes stop_codon:yes gene_type:complete
MLRTLKAISNAVLAIAIHLRIYFKFLSLIPIISITSANRTKVLIPLIYWGTTKAVWFQILMALKFMKLGHDIVFVFDYRPSTRTSVVPFLLMKIVKAFIHKIKKKRKLDFIDLLKLRTQTVTQKDKETAIQAAYFNAQWEQKKSINIEQVEEYSKTIKEYEDSLGKMHNVFSKHKFDLCFCPGGIYGSSFLWRKMCEENSVRFSSFESDPGTTLISPDGAAAHRGDVEVKFQDFLSLEPLAKDSLFKTAEKFVFNDIYKRSIQNKTNIDSTWLRTEYKTFDLEIEDFKKNLWTSVGVSSPLDKPIIFLNISWDCAALDLKPIKLSHMQWFIGLLNELISHGASNIVVRQHPDERFYPSKDKYEQVINRFLEDHKGLKIRFYSAYDDVNSYELIKKSTSVFTYTSTIGLEAAILKRPVFCAKENYQTRTRALHNYKLEETVKDLKQEVQVTDEMYANAVICYYLGQIGAFIKFSISEIDYLLDDKRFNLKLDIISEHLIENRWSFSDV